MKNHVVASDISKLLGDNIVSLVGYGSYFFDKSHAESDIDLCLLLCTRMPGDLLKLHSVISHYDNIDITVHYLDEIEQRGWNNFHHGTHGVFFLAHLGHAELLIGDDIFSRKSHLIPPALYRKSLIAQIHQYIDRVQNAVIKNSGDSTSFFIKYLSRIMIDMLLLDAAVSYREVNTKSVGELFESNIKSSSLFSPKTKTFYERILAGESSADDAAQTLHSLAADFMVQLNTVKEA